jgi:hypothetical protein
VLWFGEQHIRVVARSMTPSMDLALCNTQYLTHTFPLACWLLILQAAGNGPAAAAALLALTSIVRGAAGGGSTGSAAAAGGRSPVPRASVTAALAPDSTEDTLRKLSTLMVVSAGRGVVQAGGLAYVYHIT